MTPSWFQSEPHIYRLWGYLTPWDGLWAESCSRLCFLLGSSQLTRGETCISLSLEVQLVCILPPPVRSEVKLFSCVMTLCNPMDCSLPGSSIHGISRQEYWSGLPFPSPGDHPDPGIEHRSPTLREDTLPTEPTRKAPGEALTTMSHP